MTGATIAFMPWLAVSSTVAAGVSGGWHAAMRGEQLPNIKSYYIYLSEVSGDFSIVESVVL